MTQLEAKYSEQDANYVQRRKKQVKNVRYMVYCFVCGVIFLVFQPIFATAVDKVRGVGAAKQMTNVFSGNPINNITKSRGEGGLIQQIEALDASILSVQQEIKVAEGTLAIVNHLDNEQKQNTLATCLNTKECSGVPESLMEHLKLLRNYIILDRLQGDKMDFDQKLVLKSINEFLLKNNAGDQNGVLESINFLNATAVDPTLNLYKLPFVLNVEFPTRNLLYSFLNNISTKMNFNYPVLFGIDGVSYDPMKYENAQTVSIEMAVYYYVGEPKKISKEHASAGENESDLEDLANLINGEPVAEGEQPTDAGEQLPAEWEEAPTEEPAQKAENAPIEQPAPTDAN